MTRKSTRNPIARSFGAGINKPQVISGRKADRVIEDYADECDQCGDNQPGGIDCPSGLCEACADQLENGDYE